MAKKTKRKKKEAINKQQDVEIEAALNKPWLNQRSGITMMVLLSLAFTAFLTWQLYPTEGFGRALMWGVVSAVALWVIFLLSLGFTKLVRR